MKVTPIGTLEVIPAIPEELSELKTFAYNFRWTWDPDQAALFRELDPQLWERTGGHPARLLREISPEALYAAAQNPDYVAHYQRCVETERKYASGPSWFESLCGACPKTEIVYFSMEYGINENLPIYSGGLGVLSGDHLKSASDLGVPMIAIGLAYRHGYFQQQLNPDGYQMEHFPRNDFEQLAVTPVTDDKGQMIRVPISFPGRTVLVGAWKAQVGRVPLILLDTDVPENDPADRRITHMLYGGDRETRIQQEIVLGMGGVSMVKRLGHEATVCHMNEGHSAFIQVARLLLAMREHRLAAREALQLISAGTVFTTHTPVPAGIEQFPPELMDKYLGSAYRELGMTREDFLALGSRDPSSPGQPFNMAIFALRTANYANGVSRLHADVARNLWKETYSSLPYDEIPIDYITNGIHLQSWLAADMAALYDKYLGDGWHASPDHRQAWDKVKSIPDEELWDVRNGLRRRLVSFTRRRAADYRFRAWGTEMSAQETDAFLDPHALTIGFARRFATYKRATLLLRYPDRLLALLKDPKRPLQIIFSGKAHPQDDAGKAFIHDIVYFARSQGVEDRLVFIENYGLGVARQMVQGVDVWLNTPRRPLEASGTSGMKVLGNGGLNLSILDGWWDEAYQPGLGWAIGGERILNDDHAQDDLDARSLYAQLEDEIIPLFYDREDGIPGQWLSRVKKSIMTLVPRFNTHRMVEEYCSEYYIPALYRCHKLAGNGKAPVKELAAWKDSLYAHWNEIVIDHVDVVPAQNGRRGLDVNVEVKVKLGALSARDVEVQLYYGAVQGDGSLVASGIVTLESAAGDGLFRGAATIPESGRYGYTVRVIPAHPLLDNPLKLGLVRWATKM